MYSYEMLATNLAFQEGDLIFASLSTVKSSKEQVLKLTDSLFFFALEAIQNLSTVEMAAVNTCGLQLPHKNYAVWERYKMADERR